MNSPDSRSDIILFGIQGSGKGTQAKHLEKDFGYKPFSTGDALRGIVAEGSDLGNQIKEIQEKGGLVPNDIMKDVVEKTVSTNFAESNVIFDGFPRTIEQKHMLDRILKDMGRTARAIHIVLSEDEAKKRIAGRAQTEKRADDQNPAVIHARFAAFHKNTVPVINAYRGVNLLEVDGSKTEHEVYQQIRRVLGIQVETAGKRWK